jgi:type IV pilus assembly protein PilV
MRQKKISHHNEAGFTLIEVLISLAIFTIGILSVNAMQIASIRGNSVANGLTVASVAASSKIENIMAMPYDELISDSSTTTDGYTITWTVSAADVPTAGCKTVKVEVTGRQGNVTLSYVKTGD